LLAAVGIYGVMSYWVTQRTHEIGVRVALGAQRRQVLRLVLARAAWLILGGLTVGLVGAFVLAHFLSSLLFGVRPIDPLTFFAAAIALAGIAFVASWQPARRAAGIDPMVALRYE
jgi:putative ABC transport system permease protein